VMLDFAKFIEGAFPETKKKNLKVWCKGGSFDFPILKSAFERSSLEGVSMLPWLYWNECCFRSLLTVAGAIGYAPHPRRSVAHNALTDAIYQAEQVCEIWQRLTSPHLESL
ncbi:TPA: 3'-5' exonuclease, partial [Klebsiella pneumoniae]|nr:3'-5' exoribonuclease [Klebsiella pneumoniae]